MQPRPPEAAQVTGDDRIPKLELKVRKLQTDQNQLKKALAANEKAWRDLARDHGMLRTTVTRQSVKIIDSESNIGDLESNLLETQRLATARHTENCLIHNRTATRMFELRKALMNRPPWYRFCARRTWRASFFECLDHLWRAASG